MLTPLVSICIPSYNSEKYILETVMQALDQTWPNLEVVVVDDCSTDGTVEKLKKIHDYRFRLVENKKNLGMAGNWNECIKACRGQYIKLIPADDLLYPTCIARSVQYLIKHPDVTLVSVGTDLINDKGKRIGSYAHWPTEGVFPGRKIAKASVMLNNFYGNPVAMMFRREDFFKTGGFDAKIPYILDFDLWLGLSKLGNVAVIKKHLCAFRVRSDSNTGRLTGEGGKAYTAEHGVLIDKHAKIGTYNMTRPERWMSMTWRGMRNHIIAGIIKRA